MVATDIFACGMAMASNWSMLPMFQGADIGGPDDVARALLA